MGAFIHHAVPVPSKCLPTTLRLLEVRTYLFRYLALSMRTVFRLLEMCSFCITQLIVCIYFFTFDFAVPVAIFFCFYHTLPFANWKPWSHYIFLPFAPSMPTACSFPHLSWERGRRLRTVQIVQLFPLVEYAVGIGNVRIVLLAFFFCQIWYIMYLSQPLLYTFILLFFQIVKIYSIVDYSVGIFNVRIVLLAFLFC